MQKNLAVSLAPIVFLFGTALFLRAGNSAATLPAHPDDHEITRALQEITQEEPALKPELKATLLRYRSLKGEARKAATHLRAWKQWQEPEAGKVVAERLQLLASWDDFVLETPLRRSSGQVAVLITHDDEQLKAWLIQEAGVWKVSGIVAPPRPQVLR